MKDSIELLGRCVLLIRVHHLVNSQELQEAAQRTSGDLSCLILRKGKSC